MKMLVVDDERFNLTLAKDLIEAHIPGSDVLTCKLPETVIDLLRDQEIDIILLDIVMPKLNGMELLQQIRRHDEYKDIQIIMFTGLTDKESFRTCFEYGANDYIGKPIDVIEFTTRMRAAVEARKRILMLRDMFDQMSQQYQELQAVTQKLKEAQFHLIQSEKLASLGEIAAGVAHEINNPIGFVSSNLEIMAKYLTRIQEVIELYRSFVDFAADEQSTKEQLLEVIPSLREGEKSHKITRVLADFGPTIAESQDGVNRVAKIVRSLRNFARTGLEDEIAMHDMNQIVEEALLITKNEVKYTAEVAKNMQDLPEIKCDKGQIAQVLMNILVNASHAIKSQHKEGMGKITVETYVEDVFAVCKITDDGPGIPPEYLTRIFDPFFTTKEVGSGTGLGLSIAYGIINKHGGQFLVESQLGHGASFFIKIPYGERNIDEVVS